jgi:hypothetical protein
MRHRLTHRGNQTMPSLPTLARKLFTRRAALANASAWLTVLLGAEVGAATRSKRERRNKRRQKHDNRLEASRRCHEDLIPRVCGRNPATAAQCTADLTPCCEAARISCEAQCACYALTPWVRCFDCGVKRKRDRDSRR